MQAFRTLKARSVRRAIRGATVTTLHQAIAFDALQHLGVRDAAAWEQLFIGHARTLALGAAAPDVDFRDFRNHMLFPNDGMWGGAAAKADCWQRNLISALAKLEWENASYCAGVLSHYIIDALHPLHTAQSQADNDVYAALAHYTYVNYGELSRAARALDASDSGRQDRSAAAAVISGAVCANQQYDELLAHIELRRLASDPRGGLDWQGKALMVAFVRRATDVFAAQLASAIEQSGARAPVTAVPFAGMRAIAAMPFTAVSRWRRRRSLRRATEDAVAEFVASGHVTHAAPAEIRVKRELYAREVLARPVAEASRNIRAIPAKSAGRGPEEAHPVSAKILQFHRETQFKRTASSARHRQSDTAPSRRQLARIED